MTAIRRCSLEDSGIVSAVLMSWLVATCTARRETKGTNVIHRAALKKRDLSLVRDLISSCKEGTTMHFKSVDYVLQVEITAPLCPQWGPMGLPI